VRRGRRLRQLPACAEAWSAGEITGAHVDTIAALRRPATEAALDRDEAMLVDQARTLRYESFVRAVAYWEQFADPDGTEAEAEARRSRREVYLEASFAGMWLGKMTLDPLAGAIVSGELERLEGELFEADWAEAARSLGRDPTVGELSRTPGQRRADALVEMATRSRTAPEGGRRPAPLFSVLVDYPTAVSRGPRKGLARQRRLSRPRGSVRVYMCDASNDGGAATAGVSIAGQGADREGGRPSR
jgi:hypothetical protein